MDLMAHLQQGLLVVRDRSAPPKLRSCLLLVKKIDYLGHIIRLSRLKNENSITATAEELKVNFSNIAATLNKRVCHDEQTPVQHSLVAVEIALEQLKFLITN